MGQGIADMKIQMSNAAVFKYSNVDKSTFYVKSCHFNHFVKKRFLCFSDVGCVTGGEDGGIQGWSEKVKSQPL